MKKITKLSMAALGLLLGFGALTGCKDDPEPECDPTDPTGECYVPPCDPTDPTGDCYVPWTIVDGHKIPNADYVPTDDEALFLDGLETNNSLIDLRNDRQRPIRPTSFLGESVPNEILQGKEDVLSLTKYLPVITSEIDLVIKVTWTVGDWSDDAIELTPTVGDQDRLTGNFSFNEYIIGKPDAEQDNFLGSINARIVFGTFSVDYKYNLNLIPGELPEKMTIREIRTLVADNMSNQDLWFNKRVELNARITRMFASPPDHRTDYGFRAGIFVTDASNQSIMLYQQNNALGYGGTALTDGVINNGYGVGTPVNVRASITVYNGLLQLNGITTFEVITDEAIVNAIPADEPAAFNIDDATWATLQGPAWSVGHGRFLKDYIHHAANYSNLEFTGYKSPDTRINRGTEAPASTDDPTIVWKGSRTVLYFKNTSGNTVQVHVNYHIGPDAVRGLADLMDAHVATRRYNLVNGMLAYSDGAPEFIPFWGNSIQLAS